MKYQAYELVSLFLRVDEREEFLKEMKIQRENRTISAMQFLFSEWDVSDIETMLMSAFTFSESVKGSNYWWSIVNRAVKERDVVANILLLDKEIFTGNYASEDREEEML